MTTKPNYWSLLERKSMGKGKRIPYYKHRCFKWEPIDFGEGEYKNERKVIPTTQPSTETNTEAIVQVMPQVILIDKEIIGLKSQNQLV